MQRIFLVVLILIISVLFISTAINFKSMLEFKWNIDYMSSKDEVCEDYKWTKFEIESMRYNLSNFLYNGDIFPQIVKDYNNTYWLITILLSVIVVLFCIYFFIFVKLREIIRIIRIIPSCPKSEDKEEETDTEPNLSITFLIVFITIFIIHLYFTSSYLKMLNDINNASKLENNNGDYSLNTLVRYYNCYKILNAIIISSNLKNTKIELSHPAFTKISPTFDQLLERNIASYENTSSTSKVKSIKLEAYAKLDFLKYFVFDQLSPYYLKYFDNVYVRIPSQSTNQVDALQNIYLDDLYVRYNKSLITADTIKSNLAHFEKVDKVQIPDDTDKQHDLYVKIYAILGQSDQSNVNDNAKLQELSSYFQYYELNKKIGQLIQRSGAKINIEKDYIKYYLDNKDVLFDDQKTSDFKQKLNENVNVIYIYIFYFSLLFFLFSHFLYITVEGHKYIYIILGIITLYILFVWIFTQSTFMIANS